MKEDNPNTAGKGELTQIGKEFDCQVHSPVHSLNQLMLTKYLILLRLYAKDQV